MATVALWHRIAAATLQYAGIGFAGALAMSAVLDRFTERDGHYGGRWHQLRHKWWWGGYSGHANEIGVILSDGDKQYAVTGFICATCGRVEVDDAEPLSNDPRVMRVLEDNTARHTELCVSGFLWAERQHLKIQ